MVFRSNVNGRLSINASLQASSKIELVASLENVYNVDAVMASFFSFIIFWQRMETIIPLKAIKATKKQMSCVILSCSVTLTLNSSWIFLIEA